MPLFIQVVFRGIIIMATAVLTFLGIAPEANIVSEGEARIRTEERRGNVSETLENRGDRTPNSQPQNEVAIETPTETDVQEQNQLPPQQNNAERENSPVEAPAPESEVTESIQVAVPNVTVSQQQSEEYGIRDVVVNVVCLSRDGNKINLLTGSGVIISPKGIVISNAHVTQFFLLEDYIREDHTECTLRQEDIPTFGYTAELIHIPPDWIDENFAQISVENPRGTGEKDYSFLLITGNTNPALPLPTKFPYAEIGEFVDDDNIGDVIQAAGYPGIDTGQFHLDSNARLDVGTTFIDDVFTFDRNNSIDVFSTGPTSVARRGASGGGIFKDNKFVGLITTTGSAPGAPNNFINALTVRHISEHMESTIGQTLEEFLERDPVQQQSIFNQFTAPSYTNILGPEYCKTETIQC